MVCCIRPAYADATVSLTALLPHIIYFTGELIVAAVQNGYLVVTWLTAQQFVILVRHLLICQTNQLQGKNKIRNMRSLEKRHCTNSHFAMTGSLLRQAELFYSQLLISTIRITDINNCE